MALPLPFVRRKPHPRHAAPDVPHATAPKRRDGATIGVIVVLVLTSGFVAGTTATFTGTTSNAGNEFASAALTPPTGLSATPVDNDVNVAWTDASGYDNANAGYRVSVADWQSAPEPVPTTCATGSPYTKVGTASSSSYSDTTTATNPPHPNAYVDGRTWCYKAETVYPFPENTNPWLSQTSNPTTVVELGNALVTAVMGSTGGFDNSLTGSVNSSTDSTDYFEFTFTQAVSTTGLTAGSTYVCTRASSPAGSTNGMIFVGVSGTGRSGANNNCPQTGGTATQNDGTLRGFAFTGGVIGSTTRYTLGTVSSIGCAVSAPPGCFRLRIFVRNVVQGSATTVSGTWLVRGTSDNTYLKATATGNRNFCAASTATTTVSGTFVVKNNPTTPSTGRCSASGVATNV